MANPASRTAAPSPTRERPQLVAVPDAPTMLVEGARCRPISTRHTVQSLERVLGPARRADSLPEMIPESADEPAFVTSSGLEALANTLPTASIALAGTAPELFATRRAPTHGIACDHVGVGGGDNGRGIGPLDELALARARGATHLLVPDANRDVLRDVDLADHLARRAAILATNDAGTLWRLSNPPQPAGPKVLCIGLNKTGTTTLHGACATLGLRSYHWGGRSAYLAVLQAQRDGERLLRAVGEQYDVYSDTEPLSVRFDLLDLQYPGSRFILTTRDLDEWIDSRRRHAERNLARQQNGAYLGTNTRIDPERWRWEWETHTDRVMSYFSGRDDLLVLDVSAGEGWERLAPFLDRPVPSVPFPRSNVDEHSDGTSGPARVFFRPGRIRSSARKDSAP